ncbi:hypothetical protein CEP52_013385 [Fusarium oligoseptatum]|uniref:Uncharacterized protein n=1 Tax=Fusarium oligoseptatum TaxID=2604345 RepID=A0A428SU49_9HYPO|nr:hypothetical protein CEP52_013385 [Fusarium oligoseptatum]
MGGEAQGSVRLCRAHEEGPVKHIARPPFRAATPSHLTALRHWRTTQRSAGAASRKQHATEQAKGQRRIRTEEGTRDSRVSASHQHCLSTQQHRANACLALMPAPD